MALALVGVTALVQACDDEPSREGPAPVPPTTERNEPAEESDPLVGLDEPVEGATPEGVGEAAADDPSVGGAPGAAPPERGCAASTEKPIRVWPRPGPSAIVAQASGFIVAGYATAEGGGEEIFLVAAAPESSPRPLRTLSLEAPMPGQRIAPPGMAAAGGGAVTLAVVDGGGRVRASDVPTGQPGAGVVLRAVGEGADPRFAPAVAATQRHRLVAWTDGTGTPMRVKLASLGLDGTVAATHDVTPQAMGASAPVFADGAAPPVLFFLDARAGVSPILRVAMRPDGAPSTAEVARPIGTVSAPPRLAVASAGDAVYGGFTVVGNGATTAVGFLRLDAGSDSAAAIVPGTGYGRLHVAAASAPGAVVFAADAPKASPPTSPREVHVRIVDAQGAGPVLTLQGEDGTGAHAAIARRSDGTIGVAFTSSEAVHVAWLRCDDF